MQIINESILRNFWKVHPDAESPLRAWIKTTRAAKWKSFSDVRNTFRSADVYKCCVIFDIGGNNYRLITKINYEFAVVYVKEVLTHSEYDKGAWKPKCEYL